MALPVAWLLAEDLRCSAPVLVPALVFCGAGDGGLDVGWNDAGDGGGDGGGNGGGNGVHMP